APPPAHPRSPAPPTPVPGTPVADYPAGTHTRTAWGQGFQVGAYYTTDVGLNVGASYKSPQWFEPFRWNNQDSFGLPRNDKFHFVLPMIFSFGPADTGVDR